MAMSWTIQRLKMTLNRLIQVLINYLDYILIAKKWDEQLEVEHCRFVKHMDGKHI